MFEAVIGLEVHVQLRTATKMFCRCPNRFGAPPNSLVCATCLGYPGALPVPNRQAVDLAVRLASALGAAVAPRSVFSRKSYFYPDLPKGFQITQLDRPLAEGGGLPIGPDGRRVRLRRLHLEEDAGKLLHRSAGAAKAGASAVDFNRAGVPLVEIVTEPDLRSPAEAQDFLQSLHRLLLFTAVSDGNLEEGSLRCDGNVSLRRPGETALGTKVEVKNLNSFRFLARALAHEVERQSALLEAGGPVEAETRGWDAEGGTTRSLRGKEEAPDYRYFPEPDLPPLEVAAARRREIAAALPELPWERQARLGARCGIGAADAAALTATPELADYVEAAVSARPDLARAIAHWVRTEVRRGLGEPGGDLRDALAPGRLAALVGLVEDGEVAAGAAKRLAAELGPDEEPREAARRRGLLLEGDDAALARWAAEVVAAHPAEVARYRAGKTQLLGFFVGRVVAASAGKAEPRRAGDALRRLLDAAAEVAGKAVE